MAEQALAYLISWTCYGQWLHGDARGSVDPEHNEFGQPFLEADRERWEQERAAMAQQPYTLDAPRRRVVKEAITGVCTHRGWTLHALHVRATHVHVVVTGEASPERMMNDFKSYASRALNAAGFDAPDRRRWARHGSTRHIHDTGYLHAATNYVLNKQGPPWNATPRNRARQEAAHRRQEAAHRRQEANSLIAPPWR